MIPRVTRVSVQCSERLCTMLHDPCPQADDQLDSNYFTQVCKQLTKMFHDSGQNYLVEYDSFVYKGYGCHKHVEQR